MNDLIKKTVPSEKVIELLSKEIKEFGLLYAKDIKAFNASKSAFDRIKDMFVNENINLKAQAYWGTYDMGRQKSDNIVKVCEEIGATQCTNTLYYSPGSLIDWHTNRDNPGIRTYILYTNKPGIFRYRHPETKEVIDDYDNVGWTMRTFLVDPNRVLWHTVFSPGARFAYGFNTKV